MIAKVCDRESRRDTWFENRLVIIIFIFHCRPNFLTKVCKGIIMHLIFIFSFSFSDLFAFIHFHFISTFYSSFHLFTFALIIFIFSSLQMYCVVLKKVSI